MNDFKPGETVYVQATARGTKQYGAELVTVTSIGDEGKSAFTLRVDPDTASRGLSGLSTAKQLAVIEAAKNFVSANPNLASYIGQKLIDAVDALEPPKPPTAEEVIRATFADGRETPRSIAKALREAGLLK